MSFSAGGAMSGASAGAALGPWGAVAGGVLGGFFGGGEEPELYDADDYARDMKPYQDMVNFQMDQSKMLQDPNSWLNRQQNDQIMNNSMDQMGVANIMNARNNASNPYIDAGGINQQQNNNSLLQYANTGLQQGRLNAKDNFQTGVNQYQNAMTHQGDISSGLANLNAANVGTMNEFNQGQSDMFASGLGGLLGGISGMGSVITNKTGDIVGTGNDGWQKFMGMI